eukprot:UN2323
MRLCLAHNQFNLQTAPMMSWVVFAGTHRVLCGESEACVQRRLLAVPRWIAWRSPPYCLHEFCTAWTPHRLRGADGGLTEIACIHGQTCR